jgi:hypothetical protein
MVSALATLAEGTIELITRFIISASKKLTLKRIIVGEEAHEITTTFGYCSDDADL